jgi:sugar transferase (PEP-CTERM/EpsH1 system associated)
LFRPFVSRYIAVSPDLGRYLVGPIGVAPDRVEVIINGVDTTRFSPANVRVPIPGCPFADPGLRLVGTVGRLDPVKAQVDLANAFITLVKRRPELRAVLRLVIVGEGSERADVTNALRDAGLLDCAWLPGERNDVSTILRGLDAFVLPSRAEGVSNTVLEAMASGVPVVATAVGANSELVVDGATGRIVPSGDPSALAHAMEGYVDDPRSAAAHGEAGRQRVVQRFSLDRMVDRYQRLYLDLATRATAGHGVGRAGATF